MVWEGVRGRDYWWERGRVAAPQAHKHTLRWQVKQHSEHLHVRLHTKNGCGDRFCLCPLPSLGIAIPMPGNNIAYHVSSAIRETETGGVNTTEKDGID